MLYGNMNSKKGIILSSIFVLSLICSMPLLPAVEQMKISENIQETIDNQINTIATSNLQLKTNLKQIMLIFLFFVKSHIIINTCIHLTSFFELIILPLALELGLGPIMFFLVMIISLWLPIQIINGFSLICQQKYDLSASQTKMLNNALIMMTLTRIILL